MLRQKSRRYWQQTQLFPFLWFLLPLFHRFGDDGRATPDRNLLHPIYFTCCTLRSSWQCQSPPHWRHTAQSYFWQTQDHLRSILHLLSYRVWDVEDPMLFWDPCNFLFFGISWIRRACPLRLHFRRWRPKWVLGYCFFRVRRLYFWFIFRKEHNKYNLIYLIPSQVRIFIIYRHFVSPTINLDDRYII